MKTKRMLFVLLPLLAMFGSCATGHYMTLNRSEKAEVLGTVQSSFAITGSFRYRSAINTQAYISLLAEAQKKYPDADVDIRDISWAIGRQPEPSNYEYNAVGKVVRYAR